MAVCWQGGDLKKYASAGIGYYVSADHALGSVRDAVDRYNSIHCDFPGQFIAADCHRTLLSRSLQPQCWFDLVSCQFALHYSFESYDTASQFMWNVSERLLPGGHFVCTFPDAQRIVSGECMNEQSHLLMLRSLSISTCTDDCCLCVACLCLSLC